MFVEHDDEFGSPASVVSVEVVQDDDGGDDGAYHLLEIQQRILGLKWAVMLSVSEMVAQVKAMVV